MKTFNPSPEAWQRFLNEAFDTEMIKLPNEENNNQFKYEFTKLSKLYGDAYLSYLQASWLANELPKEDFCRLNGNIPLSFIDRL